MAEVEIRFEREGREGVVPAATYLIDAAKRFGIRFDGVCDEEARTHHCSLNVTTGSQLLSPDTKAESEYFADHGRGTNERLACQARIDGQGEVVVMTKEKVKEPTDEANGDDRSEEYRKEFAEMPLEKKIANLVQLETIALGETVSFIINSPFKVAEKVMDVMAEFGFKKEEQEKSAARPSEHKKKKTTKTTTGAAKSARKKSPKTDAQ